MAREQHGIITIGQDPGSRGLPPESHTAQGSGSAMLRYLGVGQVINECLLKIGRKEERRGKDTGERTVMRKAWFPSCSCRGDSGYEIEISW